MKPDLEHSLREAPRRSGPGERRTIAIRAQGLSKRYGSTRALDDLDLEVEVGEVLGYLGPNGAGKSTTIGLLLGFIRATGGSVTIFGMDPWRQAPEVHRRLAYVPSESNLWPALTGRETFELFANLHGSVDTAYRDELIERFDLAPDKRVRDLSHGNRQKVLLIAALAARADLLLLDEPTNGLDPLMEQVFRQCVREARDRGQTVVLSSHVLSEVEAVSDRVAMLRAGRLIEMADLGLLRQLVAVRVDAVLEGPIPDLAAVDGVGNAVVDGDRLTCEVSGSMRPLMDALAPAGITRLTTREPSLEEIFISRYGTTGGS